jgi:hypothetical protein
MKIVRSHPWYVVIVLGLIVLLVAVLVVINVVPHPLQRTPASSSGTPTTPARPSSTSHVTATGIWLGQNVTLTLYTPPLSPAQLPDKFFQVRMVITSASDPYSCLDDSSFDVYSAPESFPDQYVVFAQCINGSQSVWTFQIKVPNLTTAIWNGVTEQLRLVSQQDSPIAKVALEQLPDAKYQGLATNFQTNLSVDQCADATTPNVYTAQDEFPWTTGAGGSVTAVYLIHIVCPNPGDGTANATWEFTGPPPPCCSFFYRAIWHGQSITLQKHPLPGANASARLQSAANSVYKFQTDDPDLQCFNYLPSTTPFNTYVVQGYPTGQYLVYDRCPELAATESWIFTVTPS